MIFGSDVGGGIKGVYNQKQCGSGKIRWRRSKAADGNGSTKSIPWRKDTYIGNADSNISRTLFSREHFEMGPGEIGCQGGTCAEENGALHTLNTLVQSIIDTEGVCQICASI